MHFKEIGRSLVRSLIPLTYYNKRENHRKVNNSRLAQFFKRRTERPHLNKLQSIMGAKYSKKECLKNIKIAGKIILMRIDEFLQWQI